MWVSRIASRSLTETPCAPSSFRSVSNVDPGPGSTIARWPSDSTRAVAIDRARPVQLSSSVVIVFIDSAEVVYRRTLQLHCRSHVSADDLLRRSNRRSCFLPRKVGTQGEAPYVQARHGCGYS